VPKVLALVSVANTTPVSFKRCITVSSGKFKQLLLPHLDELSHLDELAHPPAGNAQPTAYWWQMELSHAPSTCASHRSLALRIVVRH